MTIAEVIVDAFPSKSGWNGLYDYPDEGEKPQLDMSIWA
jgi:hypothetical protein